MGRRNRSALLPTNIPQLQNLIKRDPKSYQAEFEQQYRHYEASLSIFKLKPDDEAKDLGDLITFISQVTQCFPERTVEFPNQLIELLQEHYQVLNPDLRKNMVQALILLRNKNIVDNTRLLPLFFTLFRCRDKALRELLYSHIVQDIRNANNKAKNNKLNKTLQSFMFTMLESVKSGNSDENAIAAKRSVDVCIELYRKNVWNDAKTVNVIAEACFSPITKIAVTAIQFFLGSNDDDDEDSDDDDVPDLRKMQQANLHNKKTKAKARKLDSVKKRISKKERSKGKAEVFNFSALHLLNDPQGFCEKLFSKISSKNDRWEVRLMKLNLITRIIGVHQLTLLALYPYLIKYLQPSQRDVTMVLVSAAQATHSFVPPDVLEPVLRAIANNFVTDRVSNEVMAAGINGIREICTRQPLAIDATLLQDLAEYKSHRDKGVMMGARSLIALYREVNPELLKRKDRGKEASISLKEFTPLQYGSTGAAGAEGITGIEYLNNDEENADDDWDNWEVEEDSENESEDDWVNVSDDDEGKGIDVDMSDSDEEKDKDETENQDGIKKPRKLTRRAMKKRGLTDEDVPELTEAQKSKKQQELELKKAEEAKRKEEALKLATSRILTPADFAKMNDARVTAKADVIVHGKRKADAAKDTEDSSEYVAEAAILGPRKKAKQDYEERMASIREGREGREKFGSKKGKTERGSTTNREKSRNKNFLMISHKRSVVAKSKASLHDKQKQLRAHIKKQKMKKH
ncbi:hypothetical protein INT43_005379 [Umbelopsis isabellina]|uniref:Protein SDA1 n=1 Tax=Mortierella isabellina TaxID=91625 RepID=A0A8H7PMY4_MORIS|nr:hypothetical protein INT43_005379 [Umbelopsis isabellina]